MGVYGNWGGVGFWNWDLEAWDLNKSGTLGWRVRVLRAFWLLGTGLRRSFAALFAVVVLSVFVLGLVFMV